MTDSEWSWGAMTIHAAQTREEDAPLDGLPRERTCPFDPPAEYRQLQEEQPVRRFTLPSGRVGWLITRYDDVRAVLADTRFSSRRDPGANPVRRLPPEAEQQLVEPGMFLLMDPPEHTRYRRLLTGQFTVRRMNALVPRIESIVAEHLETMASSARPVDLVQAFALPIPSMVICELLGVPYGDRNQFQQWSSTLLALDTEWDTIRRTADEIRAYMLGLVHAKRRRATDDLLSGLIHGPGGLTDEELVNMGNLLLIAGHETTANMLGLSTLTLLQHPEQLTALRADPTLFDHAVEELLRYLSIVQFGVVRVATEDVQVGGRWIQAGEPVVAAVMAADRDPARFAEPDRLELTREYSPHLAFGHGVHQCLGQQLARVELRAGLRGLLERFPTLRLAVPVEQVRMRDDMAIYGVHELPVTWDD
jgi:cytochrome P450